jgi:outer membrane protein assembly factor BamB
MRWATLVVFAVISISFAADWPQFRGPNGSAVSDEKGLPTEWGKDKHIAWKVDVPGFGLSSPVIWGDKVFVTSADSEKQKRPTGGGFGGGGFGGPGSYPKGGFGGGKLPDDVYKFEIYCLNAADGKIIWKQTAVEKKPANPKFPSNSYATETPITDGERVYASFGMNGIYCYDFSGKQIWKADIGTHSMAFGHGTASSPVLADGKLIVQCDNEGGSFVVAFDAKTGKEAWRTKRSEKTAWCSPFVWKTKDRTEVVCVGGQKIRSYDPASGSELWSLGGSSAQPKATPVANDEILFVGAGGGFAMGGMGAFGGPGGGSKGGGPKGGFGGGGGSKPLFAVKAGAKGDISLKDGAKSSDAIAWHSTQAGPTTASPLLYDGLLYILEERGGILACYDSKNGKQQYKERISGARGFTSSPWAYDGKIFCLDDSGSTHVVQAGREFKLLGSNTLSGMTWSTPAVANGALYLRTVDHLYCIRSPK